MPVKFIDLEAEEAHNEDDLVSDEDEEDGAFTYCISLNIDLSMIFQRLSLSKTRSWMLARRWRWQPSLQLILAVSFSSLQSRSQLKNLHLRWKGGIELHQELFSRWKEIVLMSW
jgi:hypothetical protein